jgi:hypothetical protein
MLENLFLSVGAMKAGTTWLYEQLKKHPDIYFTPIKELHYFANKVGIENQLNHKKRIEIFKDCMNIHHKGNAMYISENIDEIAWYAEFARPKEISNEWYESLFRFRSEKKFCADFSNLYCQMGFDGWENVYKVTKNVKVIYTLRDPLLRLWSHYKFHMKWIRREDEALDAGFEHFKNLLNKPWFWVNAEYSKNYSLLKANIRDEDLRIFYFEDFRSEPAKKLEDVQQFLDINNIPVKMDSLSKKINVTKEFEPPDEWFEYMKVKLKPLCNEMKDTGLWHDGWVEF